MLFADRREAGRRLAQRLQRLAGRPNLIVLGLPRGGVPVAFEVAEALASPLDVLVVRKVGVPGQQELAMGAVASGGVRVVNREVIDQLGIARHVFDAIAAAEEREVARRDGDYRQEGSFPDIRGKTVILVDDGVATGSTMLAAVLALRASRPEAIVVAAPVMSRESARAIAKAADAVEYVATPEPFHGVGAHYEDFSQTTDEEVRRLLQKSRRV
jgi:predicted phosphoribosyltransferase